MTALTLERAGLRIGGDAPLFVIAGVNVLENLALALHVAEHLKAVTEDLKLPFVFKASFDKANRSSLRSYRGPGLEEGLAMLAEVKAATGLAIATDIHEPSQAEPVAAVADIIQIPAFLCRQPELLVGAARAASKTGSWVHVKKGQFLAPTDCRHIVSQVRESAGTDLLVLCERGVSFGHNNLVVDMLGIAEMQRLGCPVTIDATHAVQLPGADPRTGGSSTGGRRDGVPIIAQAAVAAGADGVFLEFHPEPERALCDGPSCLPLHEAHPLLSRLKAIHAVVRSER